MSYISTLAICLFRRNDRILVFEGHHTIKRKTYFRLPGGSKDILYPNGLLEMLR